MLKVMVFLKHHKHTFKKFKVVRRLSEGVRGEIGMRQPRGTGRKRDEVTEGYGAKEG